MRKHVVRSICVGAVALGVILAVPSASSGHRTSWYWSEGRADFKYETRYDVSFVSCSGFGRSIRGDDGGRLYKHFSCHVENWNGTREEDELHVLGRRKFVVYD